MYQNVQPLSSRTHGDKRYQPLQGYGFARDQVVVPVASGELTRVAARLPLAFAKREGGDARLVALLGLDGKTNLLVGAGGRWLSDYVPAAIRRYPFILTRPSEEAEPGVVGIDTDSGVLSDGEGEPLFNDEGQPAERLDQAIALLRQLHTGLETTRRATEALVRAEVLEDWQPAVTVGEKRWRLSGLQRVSEEKLNALDDTAFAELRRAGGVALAYAQLLSTAQLTGLVRLANAREKALDRKARGGSGANGVGRGNGAGGEITFNFDA